MVNVQMGVVRINLSQNQNESEIMQQFEVKLLVTVNTIETVSANEVRESLGKYFEDCFDIGGIVEVETVTEK